jgi:hypothetical protein
MGIKAERVPLSGAARYQGNGADVDIYPPWRDAPLVAEVKARAGGQGFVTLERWLGDNDLLFLIRDRAAPMVLLPWSIYAELVSRQSPTGSHGGILQPEQAGLAGSQAQGALGAEDDG